MNWNHAYDVREQQHHHLFRLGADLRRPVELALPGPADRRRLSYFVYARVPEAVVSRLDSVTLKLSHRRRGREPGEGATPTPPRAVVGAKQSGLVWRFLGVTASWAGEATLELVGWPKDLKRADLLVCTWPRFIEGGGADDWIDGQADPLWAPSGVPLGGVGAGRVDICRDGRFRNFTLNNNQDAALEEPNGIAGAYLAVSCDGRTVDLASRPVVAGHGAVGDSLRFEPRFPQATLYAEQILAGLDVTVTLSGVLRPHDLRRSSAPGFLVRWTVRHTGDAPRTVRCVMGWPNLVGLGGAVISPDGYSDPSGVNNGAAGERRERTGDSANFIYRHWNDPAGRTEHEVRTHLHAAVRFTGAAGALDPENADAPQRSSAGEHVLAVRRDAGMNPVARGGEGRGEVAAELRVAPGETVCATMAFVAAMPHWVDAHGVDRGRYWRNFDADASAMVDGLLADADATLREAAALADHIDDSTLPEWLRRRLSNSLYPLVTNGVLYRDGRFSLNESPGQAAGRLGAVGRRLLAQPAVLLTFPGLDAAELELLGRSQGDGGGLPRNVGSASLDTFTAEDPGRPELACAFILQCARAAWSAGDPVFEERIFGRVRRALLRLNDAAKAGGGVPLAGGGVGTTAYAGSLWLATVAVTEQWLRRRGDAALADEMKNYFRPRALRRLEEDLWNGRHYGAASVGARRDASHVGQLGGQVFARLLCGSDVIDDPAKLRSCVDTLLRLNGSAERFKLPPFETGLDAAATREAASPADTEAFLLSAAASAGDERLWPLWRRLADALDGAGRHPCDTPLGCRAGDGETVWGSCGMAAPAAWLAYDALFDFGFTAGEGVLRFRAARAGRFPMVHPLFWATAEVRDASGTAGAESREVTLKVRRAFSDHPVNLTAVDVPATARDVTIEGRRVEPASAAGLFKRYLLATPLTLVAGAALTWRS